MWLAEGPKEGQQKAGWRTVWSEAEEVVTGQAVQSPRLVWARWSLLRMLEVVTGFELEENVLESAVFKERCTEQSCPADLFAVMEGVCICAIW